jgi:hypothetical protein
MNKQILSLAFALPAILASTVPALADTPVQVVQPIVKPLISPQVPILQQGFANPIEGVIAPGPGGTTVKPPKPPKPPKREIDGFQLQNLRTLSKPATINENINVAPVQKF